MKDNDVTNSKFLLRAFNQDDFSCFMLLIPVFIFSCSCMSAGKLSLYFSIFSCCLCFFFFFSKTTSLLTKTLSFPMHVWTWDPKWHGFFTWLTVFTCLCLLFSVSASRKWHNKTTVAALSQQMTSLGSLTLSNTHCVTYFMSVFLSNFISWTKGA